MILAPAAIDPTNLGAVLFVILWVAGSLAAVALLIADMRRTRRKRRRSQARSASG